MQPNFILSEAQQMLALAYVADLLGPHIVDNKIAVTPPANDANNPLPNDDGTTYPYPVFPIWPAGWKPGFPTILPKDIENVWHRSIVQADPGNLPPFIVNKIKAFGANNVIVTYNEEMDAYCVAFAGTENEIGALQDIDFTPVTAGPIVSEEYNSNTTYIVNPEYYNQPASPNQPPVVEPMMHYGFRIAVEEYTVKALPLVRHNLIEAFKSLGKSSINLFVTGHSLGAAMAGVFSAWVQAGGLEAAGITNVNLKTYTFASPKWANDALANNYDNLITKNGMSYRVVNNLDTVPQIPPTIEWLNALNNPSMVNALLPKPLVDVLNLLKLPNLNYVPVGSTYVAQSSFPVIYDQQYLPSSLFPGKPDTQVAPTALQQAWWQHWPWVYYNAMTLYDGQQKEQASA
jgi:hypothetical protein